MSGLYDSKGKYTAIAFKLGQVEYIGRDDWRGKSGARLWWDFTRSQYRVVWEGTATEAGGVAHFEVLEKARAFAMGKVK